MFTHTSIVFHMYISIFGRLSTFPPLHLSGMQIYKYVYLYVFLNYIHLMTGVILQFRKIFQMRTQILLQSNNKSTAGF